MEVGRLMLLKSGKPPSNLPLRRQTMNTATLAWLVTDGDGWMTGPGVVLRRQAGRQAGRQAERELLQDED